MGGNYMIIPDIYSESFLQMSKLWKKSYAQLCKPLNESMMTLSKKMVDISMGETDPEAYKEFYTLWMNTYNEIYGKYVKSAGPSVEIFGYFVETNNIYLGMYKSWIAALEKMSEKAKEMSKKTSNPKAFKESYNLWKAIFD
jgi:hypothetical protein